MRATTRFELHGIEGDADARLRFDGRPAARIAGVVLEAQWQLTQALNFAYRFLKDGAVRKEYICLQHRNG